MLGAPPPPFATPARNVPALSIPAPRSRRTNLSMGGGRSHWPATQTAAETAVFSRWPPSALSMRCRHHLIISSTKMRRNGPGARVVRCRAQKKGVRLARVELAISSLGGRCLQSRCRSPDPLCPRDGGLLLGHSRKIPKTQKSLRIIRKISQVCNKYDKV